MEMEEHKQPTMTIGHLYRHHLHPKEEYVRERTALHTHTPFVDYFGGNKSVWSAALSLSPPLHLLLPLSQGNEYIICERE